MPYHELQDLALQGFGSITHGMLGPSYQSTSSSCTSTRYALLIAASSLLAFFEQCQDPFQFQDLAELQAALRQQQIRGMSKALCNVLSPLFLLPQATGKNSLSSPKKALFLRSVSWSGKLLNTVLKEEYSGKPKCRPCVSLLRWKFSFSRKYCFELRFRVIVFLTFLFLR